MKNFPLFLDGDAFLVYCGMFEEIQKKEAEVKQLMKTSFSLTETAAYQAFLGRQLKCDESVEAFIADLKRLSELSGHKVTGDDDSVIIQQFLSGLPADYGRQLRLNLAGKQATISECISLIHSLWLSDQDSSGSSVSAAAAAPSSAGAGQRLAKSVICFHCGEVGHVRRVCPK